ncbi:hypothetical protein [Planococcus sp. YIM B11945]|uniref:hypothetical protein n=1 Tax=Planococcus sp. YIM B11945 TaxID=3435410 RepID=UPI003D7D67B6
MREFRSLQVLSVFKKGIAAMGIDYVALEKILQIKLTMDERRVPTIFNEGKVKKDGNQFLKSLWIYGLYGLILLPFILIGGNYIFQMSIVFGMIFFILLTSMISDFSSVLLDMRDKNILQTKPIDAKTISAAKIVHILIYMVFVTGAFSALPLLAGLLKQGMVFALILLFELIFVMLFVIVLTSLLYVFVLRFFDGERLKDVINYVQIGLSVGVFLGYQLLARTFDLIDLDFAYAFSWWHLFMPPIWFAAPFEWLLNRNASRPILLLSLLAILVPLLSILAYVRMMPAFERNLEKLLSDTRKRKKRVNIFDEVLGKFMCPNKEERLFFLFSALMMKQEREFKLKVYPTLGISLVFPFIFLINGGSGETGLDVVSENLFFYIYFCNLMIPHVIHMLKFSGNYKGSWLFKAAPIPQVSLAYSGALKAFLAKLYLPVLLVVSAAFLWIFGASVLVDLAVVLLAGVVQTLITYKMINDEEFPFSKSFEFAQESGMGTLMLLNIITGGLALAHWIAIGYTYGIYFYLVLLMAAVFIGWRMLFPVKGEKQSKNPLFQSKMF